jgi:hypothetical protein
MRMIVACATSHSRSKAASRRATVTADGFVANRMRRVKAYRCEACQASSRCSASDIATEVT